MNSMHYVSANYLSWTIVKCDMLCNDDIKNTVNYYAS